jgi:hypothetical protein
MMYDALVVLTILVLIYIHNQTDILHPLGWDNASDEV